MREIGSEFWDVPVVKKENKLFPESTQWFLSGRSALTAIIRDIKKKREVHTVAMPSWCCDSMIIPFLRANIEVKFYSVYVNGGLKQELDESCDILFLMDYFGYSSFQPDHDSYRGIVIRDVTHSLLSYSFVDADYYFGSLRKWCGVRTGGFSWGAKLESGVKDTRFVRLRTEAMLEKSKYISGEINSKRYLKVYEAAEQYLDELEDTYSADPSDIEMCKHLDISKIKAQRRSNAAVLMGSLGPFLIFPSFSIDDCPLFVPILVPNGRRDALRRYLIQHEIYCPVHWPVSKYHKLGEQELNIYENELSLVCDQRYNEEDMSRLVEVIENYGRRND